MPDNPTPATQSESGPAPGEFDFNKASTENPRIKRRSLKSKNGNSLKPVDGPPPAARELEREAPPLSAEEAQEIAAKASAPATAPAQTPVTAPVAKHSDAPAPPRVTPAASTARLPAQTAPTGTTMAKVSSTARPTTTATAGGSAGTAARPTASPHGTRLATLYYSTSARKDKEAAPSKEAAAPTTPAMKTTTTASPASAAATPVSNSSVTATRPSVASPTPRMATPVDYRANVERQSREQKSVGNILAYAVYGLIAFFVIGAGLAAYGAHTIFSRLNDQSETVSELEQRYDAANKDLTARLAVTQQSLADAQAQIARQQDLLLKQQDQLNRTLAEANDNADAIKQEKQARAQETAALRFRVRDIENREEINSQR